MVDRNLHEEMKKSQHGTVLQEKYTEEAAELHMNCYKVNPEAVRSNVVDHQSTV